MKILMATANSKTSTISPHRTATACFFRSVTSAIMLASIARSLPPDRAG